MAANPLSDDTRHKKTLGQLPGAAAAPKKQSYARSLLVPNSAIRSTLAWVCKLGELDVGYHSDVECKHE